MIGVNVGIWSARRGGRAILQLPSLKQWLLSTRGVSTVSGDISLWTSPVGNSVSQASVPNRPTYMTPPGQIPYAWFAEGEFDLLTSTNIDTVIGTNTWTVHVVCTAEGAGTDGIWGHTGGLPADQLWLLGEGGRYAGTVLAWTRRPQLLVRTLSFDGVNLFYREHDVGQRASGAATATSPPTRPITLGVAELSHLCGKVYEVALYVPALTPAQIVENEGTLAANYGI
jgi:hypothetical protein